MPRTVLWILAAVAGVLLVAGVTAAASSLSTQTIGLSSEPLSAGEQLTPRATATPTPKPKAGKKPKRTPTPTPTPTACDAVPTAVPTVDDHGGGDDSSGKGGGGDDNSGHGGGGDDD